MRKITFSWVKWLSHAGGLQSEARRAPPSAAMLASSARSAASGTRDAPGHGLRGAARAADALSSLPSSVPRPVGMIFARTRNQAIRYWPMVTRQAHTMSVGVIPGFCIWYGPLVSEQGPAPAPATGGGRLVQRPTRCVASRAQAAPRWPPTSHVEREAACCSHNERSVSQ